MKHDTVDTVNVAFNKSELDELSYVLLQHISNYRDEAFDTCPDSVQQSIDIYNRVCNDNMTIEEARQIAKRVN